MNAIKTVDTNISKYLSRPLLCDLNYKDLKKECIIRGLDFEQTTFASFPFLSGWLLENQFIESDLNNLIKYDKWVEEGLIEAGKDYLVHKSLRLSYLSEDQIEEKTNKIKNKKFPIKKEKRVKNELGLYTGTKKAYTYELAKKGKKINLIIKRVMKRFPDAKEKSIKIWFNRANKENA